MATYTLTVTVTIDDDDLEVYTENKTLAQSIEDTLHEVMPFSSVTVTE